MNKRRKHGKYRDSKHYREFRSKSGNTAKVYAGGTTSKTVKTTSSGLSTGYSKWGMCTTRHWQQPIDLGDGQVIFGSAWVDSPHKVYNSAYDKGFVPDVAVYLDDAWAAVSKHLASPGVSVPGLNTDTKTVLFSWRDYDVPDDMDEFVAILRWTLAQIDTGALVQTACFAGHGRTGTFLAGLMILKGMNARAAIASTKKQQCHKCIETTGQRELLFDLDELINGRLAPKRPAPRATADEFGRRIADPIIDSIPSATLEGVLNEMDEEDAYETWLRLNSQGEKDYTWCDYEDLPYNLCTCPDKHDDKDVPSYQETLADWEWSCV